MNSTIYNHLFLVGCQGDDIQVLDGGLPEIVGIHWCMGMSTWQLAWNQLSWQGLENAELAFNTVLAAVTWVVRIWGVLVIGINL